MRGGGGHGGPPGKAKADMPFFTLLAKTIPYIWTRNSIFLKLTFLASLVFLVAGSIGDLVVPLTFKYAIDDMSGADPKFPLYSILVYGIASFSSTACDQFRDILFAYVSANTERLVALETFEHLQSLSLSFHLQRETGSVLRSVSRGASSFAGLLRIVLFNIAPVRTSHTAHSPSETKSPIPLLLIVLGVSSFLSSGVCSSHRCLYLSFPSL